MQRTVLSKFGKSSSFLKWFLSIFILIGFIFLASNSVWAVYECGGVKDDCQCGVSNNFPCCNNGGNCTWWAWNKVCCLWGEEAAKDIANWARPRHAKYWNDRAQNSSYFTINNNPAPNTIAVREGHSDNLNWGHVAWVESVNGNDITVTEMMCDSSWGGYRTTTYNKNHFDGGFIHYGSAGNAVLTVYDFWRSSDPICADSNANHQNQNFDAQYKIKNTGSQAITIDQLALAIHHSDNSHWFDLNWRDTNTSLVYYNVTLNPGDWFHFDRAFGYFTDVGNYKVVVKAFFNSQWNELMALDFAVVSCSDERNSIKNDTHVLSWAYYTGDYGRWYISQTLSNGSWFGDVFSLSPIKNGMAGWATVGENVATLNLSNNIISIANNLDNNSSDTYYDIGWQESVSDPQIHKDRQWIQGKTVSIKWYFFYCHGTGRWYIINVPGYGSGTEILKFSEKNGQYDWIETDTKDLNPVFYLDNGILKLRFNNPRLSDSQYLLKAGEIPVYRLYNTVLKVHLYSTDANEKSVLEANSDWNYEGVVWNGYESGVGQHPVYRLYSPGLGKHLFTMDENEKNILDAGPVWQFEKIAWYANSAPASGDIPIYRLYSDGLKQHLYTADENEKNTLDGNGIWVYEGIAYYTSASTDTSPSPTQPPSQPPTDTPPQLKQNAVSADVTSDVQ